MIMTRSRKGNWYMTVNVCQLINRCVGLRSIPCAVVLRNYNSAIIMYLFAFLHNLFD